MKAAMEIIPSQMRLKAHKLCSDYLGGAWRKTNPQDISLVRIRGGASNLLYCCSLPASFNTVLNEPPRVLLRFYGDSSRNTDMSFQCEIFHLLSLKGLGPKLYGKFDDGRLEEYLPAKSLTCGQIRSHDISAIIAKKLAIVHSLNVPVDKKGSWMFDKMIDCSDEIIINTETLSSTSTSPSSSLSSSSTSTSNSSSHDFMINEERVNSKISSIDIERKLMKINFKEEINFLHQVFQNSKSPKVFSHNDLHQGNILYAEHSNRRPTLEERIVFIDFEYCSYNYRAYDIANHFSEWSFEYGTSEYPHFTYFQDKFPSLEEQKHFIHHYLKHIHRLRRGSNGSSLPLSNNVGNNGEILISQSNSQNGYRHTNQMVTMNGKSASSLKKEEDALLDEIEPFFMAVNLFWTLWCIRQAQSSKIKFGYWEHALVRWKLYSKSKSSHLQGNKIANFLSNGHH